ncbi:sodium:proton antiporter [Allostella humosa]|nr:sodium:proton antiporter [Stella humosa]BBK31373.1 sodium:proton antiporter [Stella humosa]
MAAMSGAAAAGHAFPAWAAGAGVPHIDGSGLGLLWGVPFAGILLSIAILPLVVPQLWHHHFGKISAAWALAFLVPAVAVFGTGVAAYELAHTLLLEYIPFIVLLWALFTVVGGIRLVGDLRSSAGTNTAMLAIGTVLASWMGTTGAAMLMIRPLIRANAWRKNQAHVMVFLIFLVANVGGALTPIGDPPLFLGFLKGVPFFWPTSALFLPMLVVVGSLLAIFFFLDSYLFTRETAQPPNDRTGERLGVEGGINIPLLGAIVGAVLLRGVWHSGVDITIHHVPVPLESIASNLLLVAIGLLSLRLTRQETRVGNAFSWGPIAEVAKLFAGIFITIVPVIAILRAGPDGAMSGLVALVTGPDGRPIDAWYFWLSGGLSSFLDNAPTYLVFFNLAGGDPAVLTSSLASTLVAISAGAVFMGANTYIGNAPNFMVKAIAEERGVKMPSFFGYMAWAGIFLIPLFALVTVIFFL